MSAPVCAAQRGSVTVMLSTTRSAVPNPKEIAMSNTIEKTANLAKFGKRCVCTAEDLGGSHADYCPLAVEQTVWAMGRDERDACEANTDGCAVDHTHSPAGTGCEAW